MKLPPSCCNHTELISDTDNQFLQFGQWFLTVVPPNAKIKLSKGKARQKKEEKTQNRICCTNLDHGS